MCSSSLIKKGCASIGSRYSLRDLAEERRQALNGGGRAESAGEILNIRKEADRLIDEAKKKADRIIEEAKERAKSILAESNINSNKIYIERYRAFKESGYSDGLARGYSEAQRRAERMLEEIEEFTACFAEEKRAFVNESKNIIIDMAAEIARKVVGDRFTEENGAFEAIFERVAREIPAASKLTVTLSEKDYQVMTFDEQRLREKAKDFKTIEVRCDSDAESGTIRLETDSVQIDASVKKQVDLIRSKMVAL